jgi:hypothetical protein
MDDVTTLAAKDAMVSVFAFNGITAVSALSQAVEFPPVVPAPGFLAQIAADGPLVPELWACHLGSRLG